MTAFAPLARAGDLEDDEPAKKPEPAAAGAQAAAKHRTYTLAECLAMTDRNHPNLWAARARLAGFHAQLEEAKWTPFWQWTSQVTFGVLPQIGGTPYYTAAPANLLNTNFTDGLNPFIQFSINGTIPLYTFGKIEWARRAAEAQVRVGEWDVEKWRQQVRMDVRRAFYGAMLARDARYLLNDIHNRLNKAIEALQEKLDNGEAGVDEVDRIRLEVYRDQLLARAGEPDKAENFAMAALRFMTGVARDFDIPDEPLAPSDVEVRPVVSYLAAARLFRAEVNQARATISQRRASLEVARARLFPDIGLLFNMNYSTAPSVIRQDNAWVTDPFNRFTYSAALGARWSLDILPGQARVAGAEAALEEARALERNSLGGIAVEVENAYGVMLDARRREQMWAKAEHKAKGWISSVQDAIDLGTKDEKQLTEPLRVFVDSRLSHMTATMDYNLALADLARVSGWDAAAPKK
ncbi:TolC family protein [Pendulispora albinea]|uniref:TolC family protein n=1 Tax=Pendulispora albinea TaxID=2741071 RepID=A0ABZ2MCK3_9BACT